MAKAKKEQLSLEEKLELALVREEEQPYKVPDNWVWCNGNIFNFIKGKKPSFLDELKNENSIPYVNIKYFEKGIIEQYTTEDSTNRFCEEVDILIVWDGARSGLVGTNVKGALGSTLCKIDYGKLNKDYIFRLFQSHYETINKNPRGSGLPHVDPNLLKNMAYPLPPLPEQTRIVTKIESLFIKLDRAKDLVQSALDTFENRKSAILHKAFSGELTAKWREENGVGFDSWKRQQIKDTCTQLQYGTSTKSLSEGKVIVIRMGNLQSGEIEWNKLAYTDDETDIEKYYLSKGDVLFNRTNSPEWVGKTSIYRGEFPAIFAGYLIRLKYKKELIIGEFLNYILNTPEAREYCMSVKSDGVNQSNINAKKIGEFFIPVPSLTEQLEIVRILDDLLESSQKARDLADIIDQIDLMKKSILARAFRGELGTNYSGEESALELLKDVLI